MLIPVEVEPPEDFIARSRAALADPNTHLYVDTSLLMWLTAIGPSSRAVFIDWASTLGDRIHVPTWSVHEYYRHHQRRTQVRAITEKCAAVDRALKELKSHMRIYADGPLVPERPEMTFAEDLGEAAAHVENAMKQAQAWNYDSAAVEVIAWMNDHALATTSVFDGFSGLKRRGSARYGHEVPPGYKDGHKRVNRYGDLLFWEDVIADTAATNATTVVVLTRDRKEDWFFSGLEAEPGAELRRLRPRWNPVPVAHPMLTMEMRARANAELILLDDLYLGGVMWLTDMHRFGRLAAVTFGMDLDKLEAATRVPRGIAGRAAKRSVRDTIGYAEANRVVQAAKADEDRPAVLETFATLEGSASEVDAAIEAVTVDAIAAMDLEALAALAKRLYCAGLIGPSPHAALARRLLDSIDGLDASHASAIVGGMLVAAYFDASVPRNVPTGQLLQTLLEWRLDPGVARVVEACARELRRMRSPAIYLPSASTTPIELRIEASPSNTTTPVAIGQIFIGPQGVLVDPPLEPDLSLTRLLNGVAEATVREVVVALALHFGLPLGQLIVVDADDAEARTILSTTGLDRFDPLRQPIRSAERQVATGVVAAAMQGTAAPPTQVDPIDAIGPASAEVEVDTGIEGDENDDDDDGVAMIDDEDLP